MAAQGLLAGYVSGAVSLQWLCFLFWKTWQNITSFIVQVYFGDLSLKSLCYLGLICEISSTGVGKLEVVGKARDTVEFNSVPKGHDFSGRG